MKLKDKKGFIFNNKKSQILIKNSLILTLIIISILTFISLTTISSESGEEVLTWKNSTTKTGALEYVDTINSVKTEILNSSDNYSIRITKWDEEVKFKIVMPEPSSSPLIGLSNKNVTTSYSDYNIKAYMNSEQEFKYDIILDSKPKNNKIIFKIEYEGLRFKKQLPLNIEENNETHCNATVCWDGKGKSYIFRPEEVINGYAVYHESKKNNQYKAGKVFMIYRLQIFDDAGDWVWGDMDINTETKEFIVIIPQDFLDKAVYPVRVDPKIGYETCGSSTFYMSLASHKTAVNVSLSEDAIFQNMTIGHRRTADTFSNEGYFGIYSSGNVSHAPFEYNTANFKWTYASGCTLITKSFVSPTTISAGNVWLSPMHNGQTWRILQYYDSGSSVLEQVIIDTYPYDDPLGGSDPSSNKDPTIYASYDLPEAEDTSPNVTLVTPTDDASVIDGVDFNCSATDDKQLVNISLWTNSTGTWHRNETANISGTTNSTVFSVTLPDGTYLWNCEAYDNASQNDFGATNFTVTNDQCGLIQISSSTTLTADNCEHYNITSDDVIFDCDGYTIHDGDVSNYAVRVENRDNVTINNCTMQQYDKGVFFGNSNNSLINNSRLYNITNEGVIVQGGNNISILNTQINETNSYGIWVSDVGASAGGTILIENNELNHIKDRAIYVAFSSTDNPVLILDNTFFNNSNIGIDVEDSVNITGNTFTGVSSVAFSIIEFNSLVTNSNLYNNTFTNLTTSGTTGGSKNACLYTPSPVDSRDNTFFNCTVAYTFHSFNGGINITNDIITESGTDFYNTASQNIGLYNVTFNKSNNDFFVDDNGYFDVFYAYQTNITHYNLTGVDDANVTIYDDDSTLVDTRQTNSSGLTNTTWIREYKQVGDASYTLGCVGSGAKIECDTPHTVRVTKSGHIVNSTIFTLNESDRLEHLMINVTTPTITWNSPTPNNETITTTSDIVLNLTTDVWDTNAVIDWNGTNYSVTQESDGLTYILTRLGVDNGNYTFTAYVNSTYIMSTSSRWVNVSIVSVNGYWLFRTGDRDENGDAFCRRNNLTETGGGNGNDVGCLWRNNSDGDGGAEDLSEMTEDAFCSVWIQYYFDETGDYNNQTIERMYCHTWITAAGDYGDTTNITIGFVDGSSKVFEGYGNFSLEDSFIDFQRTLFDPPVNTSGNFDLVIYDNASFNFKIDNASEFYQLTYMYHPSSGGLYPMIQSQSNLRSFCLVNPGDNASLLAKDSDGDGLNDHLEMFESYTDPYDINTDDDLWNDSVEWAQGTKGYDPYDSAFTFKYVGGVTGTAIYNATSDYLTNEPVPASFEDNLDGEFSSLGYSHVDDYKEGNREVMIGHGNETNWTMVQWNFEFNITQKPEDIETMVLYVNYVPNAADLDFFTKEVDIQNGSGNFSFRGSQNPYRLFYIERLFDNFDNILEDNKTLRFRAYSWGNFTVDKGNKSDDLRYASVWVTTYAFGANITSPLETDVVTVSYPQNITVNFTAFTGSSNFFTTDVEVTNITINNTLCTLKGSAVYNAPNWQQNCSIPELDSSGHYNLTIFVNRSGTNVKDKEVNAIKYILNYSRNPAQTIFSISYLNKLADYFRPALASLYLNYLVSKFNIFQIMITQSFDFLISVDTFKLFVVRITETISMLGLVLQLFVGIRTPPQNINFKDSTEAQFGGARTIQNTFDIDLVASRLITRVRNPAQNINFEGVSTRTLFGYRFFTQGILINSDTGRFIILPLSITEEISVEQVIDRLFLGYRLSSESILIIEEVDKTFNIFRIISNVFNVDSNGLRTFLGQRLIVQGIQISDSTEAQFGVLRIVNQIINVDSVLDRVFLGIRGINQNIQIDGSISRGSISRRTMQEIFNIELIINRILLGERIVSDEIQIDDSTEAQFGVLRIVSEIFNFNDAVNRLFLGSRTASQDIIFDSQVNRNISVKRYIANIININAIGNRIFLNLRTVSDEIQIDDGMTIKFGALRTIDQIINIGSILNRLFFGTISIGQDIIVNEEASRQLGANRLLNQIILIFPNATRIYLDIGNQHLRTISEVISISDISDRLLLGYRTSSQDIILDDEIGRTFMAKRYLADIFNFNFIINRILMGTRTTQQDIIIDDSIDVQTIRTRAIAQIIGLDTVSDRFLLGYRTLPQIILIDFFGVGNRTNLLFSQTITQVISFEGVINKISGFERVISQDILINTISYRFSSFLVNINQVINIIDGGWAIRWLGYIYPFGGGGPFPAIPSGGVAGGAGRPQIECYKIEENACIPEYFWNTRCPIGYFGRQEICEDYLVIHNKLPLDIQKYINYLAKIISPNNLGTGKLIIFCLLISVIFSREIVLGVKMFKDKKIKLKKEF